MELGCTSVVDVLTFESSILIILQKEAMRKVTLELVGDSGSYNIKNTKQQRGSGMRVILKVTFSPHPSNSLH